MKKLIILTSVLFITTSVLMAQNDENVQKKNRQKEMSEIKADDNIEPTLAQSPKHERLLSQDESIVHGKNVSSLAHITESGKGKGEIISQQARLHGESQRTRAHSHASAGNHFGNMKIGARGNSLQHRNMRMYKGYIGGHK